MFPVLGGISGSHKPMFSMMCNPSFAFV
jgi:hypothetical protein